MVNKVQLDWEVRNYGFKSRDCRYSWMDIRFIALRSELKKFPGARAGDLMVRFADNGNAEKILEHFNAYRNFRHGEVASENGSDVVNVFLAPIDRPLARV
jgi:hypothetical protein